MSYANPPDMGGDYDGKAPHYEWNYVNNTPIPTVGVAHCWRKTNPRKEVEIFIPNTMKRCILTKSGYFSCRTGTISHCGYTDAVRIEMTDTTGNVTELQPTEKGPDDKRLVWRGLDVVQKTSRLVVKCHYDILPKAENQSDIPLDMKTCSLVNRRFRCTTTPEEHDLFWPVEADTPLPKESK